MLRGVQFWALALALVVCVSANLETRNLQLGAFELMHRPGPVELAAVAATNAAAPAKATNAPAAATGAPSGTAKAAPPATGTIGTPAASQGSRVAGSSKVVTTKKAKEVKKMEPKKNHKGEHKVSKAKLEHKAHKIDEIREEYREKRKEAVEELDETARFRNSVCVALGVIILLTLLFETGAKDILLTKDEYLRPILHIIFKELTVLGFLSLFVFVMVQTGYPQKISEAIFDTPSELIHMFHHVHWIVFFVMVTYVSIVLSILQLTRKTANQWKSSEFDLQEKMTSEELHPKMLAQNPPHDCSHESFSQHKLYAHIRNSFVNPPTPTQIKVDRRFDFAMYLSSSLAETYAEIVELGVKSWGVVLFLVILVRFYMMIKSEGLKLVIFVSVGWLTMVGGILVRGKLRAIHYQLTGIVDPSHWVPFYAMFGVHLDDAKSAEEEPDAPYLRISSEAYSGFRGEDGIPSKHELLFWGNRKGPGLLVELLRTMLFFQAIYAALILFRFRGDIGEYYGVGILCMIVPPLYTILVVGPEVVILTTVTTSTNMMRRRAIVDSVKARQRHTMQATTSSVRHSLKVLAVRLAADESAEQHGVKPLHALPTPKKPLAPTRRAELKVLFEVYDDDGNGTLDPDELEHLLASVGMQPDQHEKRNLQRAVGAHLSFEDFCLFMASWENGAADSDRLSSADILRIWRRFGAKDEHDTLDAEGIALQLKHVDPSLDLPIVLMWILHECQDPSVTLPVFEHMLMDDEMATLEAELSHLDLEQDADNFDSM